MRKYVRYYSQLSHFIFLDLGDIAQINCIQGSFSIVCGLGSGVQ